MDPHVTNPLQDLINRYSALAGNAYMRRDALIIGEARYAAMYERASEADRVELDRLREEERIIISPVLTDDAYVVDTSKLSFDVAPPPAPRFPR